MSVKKPTPSLSFLLKKAVEEKSSTPLTYKEIIGRVKDKGLGMVMVLFALPSALPISIVPGLSFIFSLPILFVAGHLIMGKHVLWLPAKLANKEVNQKKLELVVRKTYPYLKKFETLLKPRLLFLSSPLVQRFHGIGLLGLSLLLLLPIPFSNFIFAFLIICFGMGMMAEDGCFLIIAWLGSIIYLAALVGVVKIFI